MRHGHEGALAQASRLAMARSQPLSTDLDKPLVAGVGVQAVAVPVRGNQRYLIMAASQRRHHLT